MLRSAVLDGWKTVRGREERKRRRTEGRSWFCLRLGAMMATALLCRLLGSSMVVVVQEGRSWCWLGWKSLRREWCSTRVSIFHLSELNESLTVLSRTMQCRICVASNLRHLLSRGSCGVHEDSIRKKALLLLQLSLRMVGAVETTFSHEPRAVPVDIPVL